VPSSASKAFARDLGMKLHQTFAKLLGKPAVRVKAAKPKSKPAKKAGVARRPSKSSKH
jgi:hypothetical protein